MGAAVLRPRGLVARGIEGPFLSIGDGGQPVSGDAEVDEIVAGGAGALLAEGEVVIGGPALVAVALDGDFRRAMVLHPQRMFLEDAPRLVGEASLVVVEVDVGQRAPFTGGVVH